MDNLTNESQDSKALKSVYTLPEEIEQESTSEMESLLRTIILGYQNAFNKNSKDTEYKYYLTVTTHKIDTPEGKKDIGYLRLERAARQKGDDSKDAWTPMLIHQEMHVFKSIQEQANPKAPWREQLYLNCLARMASAGLEYAELLMKMKKVKAGEDQVPKENKLDLVITDQMPKPLSEGEQEYKEWVEKNTEFKK